MLKKYIIPAIPLIVIVTVSTIVYIMRKPITVIIDGKPMKIVSYKSTVKEVVENKKITVGPKDKIMPAFAAKVAKNDTIAIKRAVNVKVAVDGKDLSILSAEENIEAMLKAEGITYKTEDKINPAKDTKLSAGMNISIVRVDARTSTETLVVDFKTVVKKSSDLPNTYRKITQEGANGERKVTTTVIYEDNKEVSRKTIEDTITKKPIDKVIVQGTYPSMPVSSDGKVMSYSRTFTARATAYSAIHGIGKTYTASGRKAVRNPNGYSTIAVDPSVISFGTKLFVEGYGFAIAADSGSGVLGNSIDVFFDTYKESCNWAVKHVKVYILK